MTIKVWWWESRKKYRIHICLVMLSFIGIVFGMTILYLNKLQQGALLDLYWMILIAAGAVGVSNVVFISGFIKYKETVPPTQRLFWLIVNGIGLVFLTPLANSSRMLFYLILTGSMLSTYCRVRQRDCLVYLGFLIIAFALPPIGRFRNSH